MVQTVRQFIHQSWKLINPSNPTQPLHGNDESQAILIMNELMDSYAATGLMITIAKTVSVPVTIGQQEVVCGPASFVPLPDITTGRLANLNQAWLELSGVDYPLIPISRDEFLASYRYAPLQGLPTFAIVFPDTEVVRIQLYPAPSQTFQFFARGKFQLSEFDANADMSPLPGYYSRYLKLALARDLALYKGRASAWTDKLEKAYIEAEDKMVSSSEVNLTITGDNASMLNGAWRVRAGI